MQSQRQRDLVICIALAAITLALFWPLRQHDFVNYDDPLYLTKNSVVQNGLTLDGVKWAFGRLVGNGTYWHPLTWLSHMLDWQLFQHDAGKHHLVSLFFHTANVLLLFVLLNRLTQKPWRSAMVAALFAWHPLQVDSVAWLAERKNLLSTFFGLLALLSYIAYARKKSKTAYGLALLAFALTLMCKPFVTLPCVLLLLDIWPLQRLEISNLKSVIRNLTEKIPFFALSIASGVITILSHKQLELITEAHRLPLSARLANSAVAYWRYVRKVFLPNDLAVYYPLPDLWPPMLVVGSAIFFIGLSAFAIWSFKKRPHIFVGWFWFVGVLVPFIGLMQVNDQAMADRFAYVPLIGLFIALVWATTELLDGFSIRRNGQFILSALLSIVVIWASSKQLSHWKNSETLFSHAIKVAESNIAHINYGVALEEYGTPEKLVEAKAQYERALELVPNSSMAESNLGVILGKVGKLDEAVPHFRKAIEINPDDADAHSNFGLALTYLKRPDDAVKELNEALRLKPDHPNARVNLGNIYFQQGKLDDAAAQYERALSTQPDNADVHNNLGFVLLRLNKNGEARTHLQEALRLRPNYPQAHFNLAKVLKAEGHYAEAIQHCDAAVRANSAYIEARLEWARLLKQTGQDAGAKEQFDEVLRSRPDLKTQVEAIQNSAARLN